VWGELYSAELDAETVGERLGHDCLCDAWDALEECVSACDETGDYHLEFFVLADDYPADLAAHPLGYFFDLAGGYGIVLDCRHSVVRISSACRQAASSDLYLSSL